MDAFCLLVKKEPELNANATRILANKIQSQNVKESLYALDCLEGKLLRLILCMINNNFFVTECMDILGTNFHIEINKFKFLNELVSFYIFGDNNRFFSFMSSSSLSNRFV